MVSGLRINIRKSTVIGINVDEDILKGLAEEIGCSTRRLPLIYRGLPVGGNPRLKQFWAPVIEKIERRLVGWGRDIYPLVGILL